MSEELDTSILDELDRRHRRRALRDRGAATGRVRVSAPRPLPPRKPKVKAVPRRPGPDRRNTSEAKERTRQSIEERRVREGDYIADAVLGILRRLASP